jgi:AmiR/NasT family two-component response regulator
VIEQAKGMLAEHAKVDMDQAFRQLREFARAHNRRLSVIAAGLVTGEIELGAVSGDLATGAS